MARREGAERRNTVGARALRLWLRENRVTQVAFATKLRTRQGNVSDWLLGKTPPRASTRARIRDLTGIPILAWDEDLPAKSEDDAA